MLKLELQMFGGRGGSGGSGSGANRAAAQALHDALKVPYSPEGRKALDEMPVGTKIYDGSKTLLPGPPYERATYYEATAKHGDSVSWTLFGETDSYSSRNSSSLYDTLRKERNNSRFNLKIEFK